MPSALKKSDVPFIIARIREDAIRRRGLPVIRRTVRVFGQQAANVIGGVSFNEENRRVSAFLRNWGGEHIKDINRTTQRRVRQILVQGIEAGKGYEELGKAIGHVFHVAEGSRAEMIARTEVHRASNFASEEGFRQVGIQQKEWQHTSGGADARPDHIEMDGQVVDIDDDFESPSGATAPYPGEFGDPAEDINCQCGVLPVVDSKRFRFVRHFMAKANQRLRLSHTNVMRRAMSAGFHEQRQAVIKEFESRADKSVGAEAA